MVALLGALAVTALALAGGTSASSHAAPIKAAWIYVGPHNDAGWSQAHDMGRLYVQKQLGTQRADDVQGEHRERRAAQADGGEPRP